jgi:hypothetical protein
MPKVRNGTVWVFGASILDISHCDTQPAGWRCGKAMLWGYAVVYMLSASEDGTCATVASCGLFNSPNCGREL